MGKIEYCDLCGKIRTYKNWTTILKKLVINIYVSSRNPLGYIKGASWQNSNLHLEDVCDDCRREYAYLTAKFLQKKFVENPRKDYEPKKIRMR